jgi:hypothetical protein
MPRTAVWLPATMVYTKIYSNSAMVSLNMRRSYKNSESRSGTSGQSQSGPVLVTRTYNIETDNVGSTHDTEDNVRPSSVSCKWCELMRASLQHNTSRLNNIGNKGRELAFSTLNPV